MPAMPTPILETGATGHGLEPTYGLTKREMFAMHAMSGLMANTDSKIAFWKDDAKTMAQYAITITDALLDELEK